jgi:hypothetical protein
MRAQPPHDNVCVTKQQSEAAAAARVAAGLGRRKRTELLTFMRPAFSHTEAWLQAARYTAAVMSDLPRRNGWTIAKLIGDKTPDRTQRLLNRASGDEAAAMGAVRRFAVTGLDQAARGPAAAWRSGRWMRPGRRNTERPPPGCSAST